MNPRVTERMIGNARRNEKRLLEQGRLIYRKNDDHDPNHFFSIPLDTIINDIPRTDIDKLCAILTANDMSHAIPQPLAEAPPIFLKNRVIFLKCFTMHSLIASDRECGNCHKLLHNGRRCGQCGIYQYCSRECQRVHWKCHKPFCAMSAEFPDECEDKAMVCVCLEVTRNHNKEFQESLEAAAMPSQVSTRKWDGHSDDGRFEELIAYASRNGMSSRETAVLIAGQPPNVAQIRGPKAFLKFVNYALDQCNTPFVKESISWQEVLYRFVDPTWPEQEEERKSHVLRPNVEIICNSPKVVEKLFKILVSFEPD
jgi:hypothetical protein